MRIAHVSEAWNGGISTYINTLIRHQAQDPNVDDIALIYSPSQVSGGFDVAGYEALGVRLIPYESSRNPLMVLKCARDVRAALRGFQPDIIHLHSSFAGIYGRVFTPEFPTVYCAHGWSFTEEDGAVKRFVYGAVEQALARRSAGIINISEREFNNAKTRGIDARVHCVVLNGVDDCAQPLPDIDFKLRGEDTLNIGFIGRLDPKKGFDLLHDYMRSGNPHSVHLTVIGEASRSAADYSQDDTANITYLGWVDIALLDSYIRQFDAIIVPSRHEGFGLVVIEAMRNGVPAIVARDTAMPEIVSDGRDGFLFDISDFAASLDAVLAKTDRARLIEMGKAARQTYESRFRGARMADDIMNVYRKVLYKAPSAS